MSRSVLQGGRRRRRLGGRLALLAALLVPAAVAIAAWGGLLGGEGGGSVPPVAAARGAGAGAASAEAPARAESERPPAAAADRAGTARTETAAGVGAARADAAAPAGDAAASAGEATAPAGDAAVRLERRDTFSLRFKRPPHAGLVFDLDSGEVLWRLRAERELPMASLTKMMSALVVVERTRPRERVRITRAALRYRGSGVGKLPRGKRVPIEALLHGMLMPSGNDAAIALAVHVAGSERRFVELMNERARELSLECTRFVSSHGLEAGNRSCAADLAALARLDMRELRIRRVVRKQHAALRFPIKRGRLFLKTTNPLIRGDYPGAIGLKTGYTTEAGRCLVGVARRRGRTLGVVLLDSPDPGRQARKLLNLGFHRG